MLRSSQLRPRRKPPNSLQCRHQHPSPPRQWHRPTRFPDVARIKGDLIGETVRGGVLTTYKFDSLDEIISLKQVNKATEGNRAEFKLDAVLRKETGSTKRCFAVLNAVYTRTAEGDPWAFSTVRADTFTCE